MMSGKAGGSMDERGPRKIDPRTPNVARMYDYYLGGKDHYSVDRKAAEQILQMDAALIGTDDSTVVLDHDLRNTEAILGDTAVRKIIDFDQPVGLMLLSVLHCLADDEGPRLREAPRPLVTQ